MAKAKAASKENPKKQPKEETSYAIIKLADFIGQKLVDMQTENSVLTIKFSNGYNIIVKGNISLKKEKED